LCQKAYRQANQTKVRAGQKAWAKDNPDKIKAHRAKRRSRPEVKKQRAVYKKNWRKRNPDKIKAQNKRGYDKDPDKRRATARKWRTRTNGARKTWTKSKLIEKKTGTKTGTTIPETHKRSGLSGKPDVNGVFTGSIFLMGTTT
jgi:hypothetical protein